MGKDVDVSDFRKVTAERPTNRQLAEQGNALHDCVHAMREEMKGEISQVRHEGRNRQMAVEGRFNKLDRVVSRTAGQLDVIMAHGGLPTVKEGEKAKKSIGMMNPWTACLAVGAAAMAGANGYKFVVDAALSIHHLLLAAAK